MSYSATYSPEDNKLRLYSLSRLPKDLYDRVKAAGFEWAPKQELFVAPMWTPGREDLLLELCDQIEDEDTTLVYRAEERSERFSEYSDKRADDTARAHKPWNQSPSTFLWISRFLSATTQNVAPGRTPSAFRRACAAP